MPILLKRINTISTKILGFWSALLFPTTLLAQTDFSADLQDKFAKYALRHEREKLFVHTDKSFYVTGETIWFKIYDVNATFNRPGDLSKVAYVEVLNKDQKPLLQAKIGLKESTGTGSLVITSSFSTGSYTLRAYTNWMKNFDPGYFFEKQIVIVNPLKGVEQQPADTIPDYDVQFFPEGGNLVYGLESKIGFRVAGKDGKGVQTKGAIVNGQNDTVVTFSSYLFGLGQFRFTPQKNEQYKAILMTVDRKMITGSLPRAYEQGYVMSVSDLGNRVGVTITTNLSQEDQNIFLFIHDHREMTTALMKAFHDGKAEFAVDKAELHEGISQLTVFSAARQPVCERLYFKRPEQLKLDISVDRHEFATRQKVSLELSVADSSNSQSTADLSMSVYRVDSVQQEEGSDITSYTSLTSELKGEVESPGYYLDHTGVDADQAIDNLLLTQGWRKFNWAEVLVGKEPSFEFIPEYAGHIVTCRIVERKTDLPVKGVTAYASVPGKRFQFSNSTSDQNGVLHFDLNNFYGAGDLIVQTNERPDSLYRIEVLNPFLDRYDSVVKHGFEFSNKGMDDLLSRIMSAQVQTAYGSAHGQKFTMSFEDTAAFYGKADKTYFLDDYVRFATMEEVMREYVTEVLVRKSGNKFHFRVSNLPYKLFFETDPLVLIDGTPVFDIDKMINFDPLKLKKIDVVTRKYYFGNDAYSGIVSCSTYDGDLGGYRLEPGSLLVEYQGLQLQRQFYSPVYETKEQEQSRLPDLRNVLQWSPQIQITGNQKRSLSFYTSDLPGKYVVAIQGMTSTGLTGSHRISFTVKK